MDLYEHEFILQRVTEKNKITIINYNYERLGLQMFDTVKFFCSENHHYQDKYISDKIYTGFLLGFESSIYEFGIGFKGFRNVCILPSGKKVKTIFLRISKCSCEMHSDLKYIKLISTKMVLTEKTMFNMDFM